MHQLLELNDAQYCTDVLQLSIDKPEAQADFELVTKANALGIQITLPSIAASQRSAPSAASQSTGPFSHDSSISASSDGTSSDYLTPNSSIFGFPSPEPINSDSGATRPESFSFSPYEKYLERHSHVVAPGQKNSSLGAGDGSNRSIFSISTRRSLSGIRNRIKLRRKPTWSSSPIPCASSLVGA